jgi:nitrilase
MSTFQIAAVQATPVLYDRRASVEKACDLIARAAAKGACLAAFGEVFVPGYPFHVFSGGPAGELWFKAAARYIDQAIEIPSADTDLLCAAARRGGIDVVIGVAERDTATNGTVYCTLLFIGSDGEILGKHRKLKPTANERVAWGQGLGDQLQVYQRSYARISGLNCFEHMMMLPAYTLAAQGAQIHIAAWPGGENLPIPPAPQFAFTRQHMLSAVTALQMGAYVICAAACNTQDDLPEDLRSIGYPYSGDSAIFDPRGEMIAGPVRDKEEILLATVDLEHIRAAKAVVDLTGHYARPDLFDLRLHGHSVLVPQPCEKDSPEKILSEPSAPSV